MAGAAAPVAWAELSSIYVFFLLFLSFLFPFLEGNQYKFIPFFVLFFLLCCLCRTFAWVLSCCCCCCLCYFPLQKTNSLHTHTTTRNRSVSAYACLRAFVCVRAFHLFSFVLLFTVAQWNEENWTELNWRIFLRVFTVPPKDLTVPSPSLTFLLLLTGKVAHFKQHKREEDRKFQLTNRTVDVAADMTSHDFHFHFVFLFFFFELLLSSFGCQPARSCTHFDFVVVVRFYVFSLHNRRNWFKAIFW